MKKTECYVKLKFQNHSKALLNYSSKAHIVVYQALDYNAKLPLTLKLQIHAQTYVHGGN